MVEIVKIDSRIEFDFLYERSVLTFEGVLMDMDNLNYLESMLKDYGYPKDEVFAYMYFGKDMNEIYGLTDDNAYPDDLVFLSVPDFYSVLFKLQTGARWFDDIVDNNQARQSELNRNKLSFNYSTLFEED